MSNGEDQSNTEAWSRKFAEEALRRATAKFGRFDFPGDLTPEKAQRFAEAVIQIGWMIVDEVALLKNDITVSIARETIVSGLGEVMTNGHRHGPHLAHDIVTALALAFDDYEGRKPKRFVGISHDIAKWFGPED